MDEVLPRSPWVGSRFNETNLLIVGESHYWDKTRYEDSTLTNEVISGVIDGKRLRFFTLVEGAVTGCTSDAVKPDQFWPTVAFANFCQGVAALGERPDQKMWRDGARVLHKVVDDVKPTRMLFVSKEAWKETNNLEGISWEVDEPLIFEEKSIASGYFISDRTSLRVYSTVIPHPQFRGWGTGLRWHPLISQFMDRPLKQ